MENTSRKRERGSVEVEAIIILPIAILSVVLLLYLSLFMFQRANLQAGLETTLVYYKNTITDSFVTKNEKLDYVENEESLMASGNSYKASSPLNPYRGMFGDSYGIEKKEDFETYFKSVVGNMLFDDNLTLTIDHSNYVVLKQIEVTATQTIEAPIDFSILGVDNEFEISATAKVNVIDHDDLVRNVDYAIDILEDTKLGEIYDNIASKVGEAYNKMKEVLGAD